MEITCNRCHQPIREESCYCPTCGLPQLVYATAEGEGAAPAERWNEAVRDASEVEWRPALRAALLLAIPAGLLSCGFSPVSILGLFWVAAAATWAVSIYVRRQKAAWITLGAGARIGLVTGLIAGWLAFGTTGAAFYCNRFLWHEGKAFDDVWTATITQNMNMQMQAMNADAQAVTILRNLLSPEGKAGSVLAGMVLLEVALLVFAAAGGALGARMMAGSRRPSA